MVTAKLEKTYALVVGIENWSLDYDFHSPVFFLGLELSIGVSE